MLLSGTDNHIAGVGQMGESVRQFNEDLKDKPGYEGILHQRVVALSEILKEEGYFNTISGKWHLGLTDESSPTAKGFEKSFALLPGAGNHYKYFPLDPTTGETPNNFLPPLFEHDGELFHAGKQPGHIPDDYYSTKFFTDKLLEQWNSTDRKGRPFFSLLTYTAPHWPLQAPQDVIEKYKGVYDKGPRELRAARLKKATQLGIIAPNTVPHEVHVKHGSWETFATDRKERENRIMETYAGMVDVLDKQIGRVLDKLESEGELDNTFILFMSDNGAEGAIWEAFPLNDHIASLSNQYYNNKLENIGNKNSFVFYSDEWAQAATAPNFMYKFYSAEGGIKCPLIVSYPKLISQNAGKISNSFLTVMDILPTVLEIAGVAHPGEEFKGRKVSTPIGKTFTGVLKKPDVEIHTYDDSKAIGWELFAQRAIRRGDWKITFIPEPFGSNSWELYNVKNDPGETLNLATKEPKIFEKLKHDWAIYVAETGLIEVSINSEIIAKYHALENSILEDNF
ncbi:Arylsulfatase [Wickerhamomyces ciferrii]|uniref:Arylsulfatase n=1 Tax=Wickerhamomyces ciferrii (strain ATCC 14091 / BCRC 22168 / CBS 111 / JCM 3599 / NBRC 0793 / NRRL Y-1031 F-60-10) TaxID=1206466 RepID=K0KN53_WICCF|nr:Arylsulfatase [Wickerhamomyces ciferrii]CCH42563.1 Arylsulfatase [Wickerhamomyces ciferrii]